MNLLSKEWSLGKDIGILIIRILFGFVLFYGHGLNKLNVIITGQEIKFLDPIGIGVTLSFYLVAFAEGICALLLIVGLFTRLSSIVLIINFIVILYFHKDDEFKALEAIYFYLFTYVALLFTGAGKYALDNYLFNKKR